MSPEIIYLLVGLVAPLLMHKLGVADLSGIFAPAAPGGKADPALPPPLVSLPNRPTLQLLEQKLEAAALAALHAQLDRLVTPAPAAPASPAAK